MTPRQLATAGVRLLAVYFGLGGLHTGLSAFAFGAHAERLPPFIVASTLRAAAISIAIGVVLWFVATRLSHLLLPDPVDETATIARRDLLPVGLVLLGVYFISRAAWPVLSTVGQGVWNLGEARRPFFSVWAEGVWWELGWSLTLVSFGIALTLWGRRMAEPPADQASTD